jgi:choline dehydrogenase-like flavoprotein
MRTGARSDPGCSISSAGHTKFYGTAMFRFRERDFEEVEHEEGVSPAWPDPLSDLEPWYGEAERLFGVTARAAPTPRTRPAARPTATRRCPTSRCWRPSRRAWRSQGLRPFPMPSAIDLGAGGRCQRCANCDAVACRIDAKGDAKSA